MRLGVASYCLPIIAIAPILQIMFNGQTPKIILAALSVFFTTLVGTLVGLRSADKTTLDVIHAYGGGAVQEAHEGAAARRAAEPVRGAAHRGAGRDPRRDHRRVLRRRVAASASR